ncbi:hypothetical protein HDE69_004179 [Pedobacter cryoconitis]|uniref:Uncharacterized protein n=1 Tax=Pedobacter cryoconitis TaxID=188932 RepID=A0A7W8YWK8_9SPHI|nr:hypothetical protein [Pedobacter cryoconitis]MBB5623096.1 hypothetical protein [Pedobacter cryoconitis]
MARRWYAYNGVGDPLSSGDYNIASYPPSCINGVRVCAIYATGTGQSPSFLSSNLRNYISNLYITLVAQPDSDPAIKKYVYGKS